MIEAQPRPTRRATVYGLYVVALAAAILSFDTLDRLGKYVGFGAEWSIWRTDFALYQSWLLPLSIDALGFIAVRVWFDERLSAETRELARRVAWVDITVSMGLNAAMHVSHVLVPHGPPIDRFRFGLILVVSLIPPFAFAIGAHLAAKVADDTGEQAVPAVSGQEVTAPAPEPVVEEVSAELVEPAPPARSADLEPVSFLTAVPDLDEPDELWPVALGVYLDHGRGLNRDLLASEIRARGHKVSTDRARDLWNRIKQQVA